MRRIGSALVVGLFVAACGGSSSDGGAGDTATTSSVAESTTVVEATTTQVTDEPTTVETTTSTDASETRLFDDGKWVQVAVDEPWVGSVLGIAALPGGGYVAVTGSGSSAVMWSPDGVEWSEGDPSGEIAPPSSDVDPSGVLAVAGDQVVVVDGTDFTAHVPLAIGDPRAGVWEGVVLDFTALDGREGIVSPVNLAASDEEVLVATLSAPVDSADVATVVTWVVDPTTGTSETNSFALGATPPSPIDPPLVAWVDGRWILITDQDASDPGGGGRHSVLWTSDDALEWSPVDLPEDMAAVRSLTAGPRGVVAVNEGVGAAEREPIWYSIDGLEWTKVRDEDSGSLEPPVISAGKYGFVTAGEPRLHVFADDSDVYWLWLAPFDDEIGGEFDELGDAGASSEDTLLVLSENDPGLWLYSAVALTPVEWSTSNWGASTIIEARPLDAEDVGGIGAGLIWEETTITLTSSNRIDPRTGLGDGRITIREAGDGYVHIGDIYGFDERPDMEEAAANHGPPIAACIYIETAWTVHDYCAPLTLADD